MKSEGVWAAGPDLSERLVDIGGKLIRLTQSSDGPNGSNTSSTYLDKESLSPLRFERKMIAADGELTVLEHTMRSDGYDMFVQQGELNQTSEGPIGSTLYDGVSLGLAMSRLSFDVDAYSFQSSMIGMQSTYSVTATLAERTVVQRGEDTLDVLAIDVEWHHNEIGDIYLPGPDASGGRYWIVQSPPDGVPYVLRYQTDTYVVEFDADVCPALIGAAD